MIDEADFVWMSPTGQHVEEVIISMGNYPTCGACKWWEPYPFGNNRFGFCQSPKHITDMRLTDADMPTDLFFTDGITTGRDFGCVHWTAKEEETET